jgi:hypothetical protein
MRRKQSAHAQNGTDDTYKQMPVYFQNDRPPMGHRAANGKKRGLRYVAAFGQLSVKAICLTTR